MDPDEFLRLQPKFHYDEHNKPISWAIGIDALKIMGQLLPKGGASLETGSGVSTAYLAALTGRHTAIAPDGREFAHIRQFCAEHRIGIDHVRFIEGYSERVLPTLDLGRLDLVLIDGRHAFPSPFIDWYYTADALRVGGTMVVDDTHLWTGRVLADFMADHPSWRRAGATQKTEFFTKLDENVNAGEWNSQPYLMKRM